MRSSIHGYQTNPGGVDYQVWIDNGNRCIDEPLAVYLEKITHDAVGELYLNSMGRDGTIQGYDLRILDHLPELTPISIILANGAGNFHHLAEGLLDIRVDVIATAHLFNFVGNGLERAREGLIKDKFELTSWPLMQTEWSA